MTLEEDMESSHIEALFLGPHAGLSTSHGSLRRTGQFQISKSDTDVFAEGILSRPHPETSIGFLAKLAVGRCRSLEKPQILEHDKCEMTLNVILALGSLKNSLRDSDQQR
jgi:hypothetical protein